jgi:cell division septum initiation protein DivIVA
MNDAQQAAALFAALVAGLIGVLTLIGLAVRWVLLPYIRSQVVLPIRQINRQVAPTDSDWKSEPMPTVMGQLEEVVQEVRQTREENRAAVDAAREEVRQLGYMFDGHLEWSQDKVDELAAKIREAREIAEQAASTHERKHESRDQTRGGEHGS